ncbi:hypothetical protein JMJ77_0015238 [Colletotrichum scovillei]|uniref:Uncharacterized protein n=1 Tax=Colletotrichum scovillei TaxID=1209932 RepID=A0A9P7UAA2_9PEZI|nr:hypothetical protein JMJ77_0015238 [Colletotrichum scovillei]KAG7056895.1 hypothetical protein JMJ78_0000685 [Colletotrichum scovillei]KAG7066791.1 hypothetical protein JMJ76_0000642 [Colletotrichum scovillei]
MCEEILSSHLVAEDDSSCTLVNATPHYPESLAMRHFLEKFVEASDETFEVDFSLSASSVRTAFRDSWPVDVSDENGAGEATLCTLDASSRLKERRNMMNKYQESDIVEYENGLDCEAFDDTDFLWEETTHIGVKGLLEYLKDDIIQQIHYDIHNQDDDIASQPILLEGNSQHHTITRLNIQAYNGEVYGDRPGDLNKDDHQAPTHSITRQNLIH